MSLALLLGRFGDLSSGDTPWLKIHARIVRVNWLKATGVAPSPNELISGQTREIEESRIGLGKPKLARGFVKNNARDSFGAHGSNRLMTNDDSQTSESETAMNTLLALTLTLAATVNAWCLYMYL